MVHIQQKHLANYLISRATQLNHADVLTALSLLHKTARFLRMIEAYTYKIHMCIDKSGIIYAIQLDGQIYPVRRKDVA